MQMGRIAIEPTQIGRIDSANRPFRTSVEFTQIRQRRVFRLQSYFCSQMVSGFALVHAHKRSGQNIVNGLSEVLQGFLNLCAADDGGSMPPAADIRNGKRPAYQDYEATEPDRGTVRPEWRRDLENSRNKYRRNRELFSPAAIS